MNVQPLTDAHATLGALLRRPYEDMSTWVYAQLAANGFEDVRPAFSAVLRNAPAQGARVSELAARAGMTKQSMGYLVEQMVACGLVELAPDPVDGRAKTVRLTERGRAAVDQAVALSARYEDYLGSLVGARKLAQLRAVLTELHAALAERPYPPLEGR